MLKQYVQVKTHKTTVCGRICGVWTTPDGQDLWNVQLLGPVFGILSSHPKNTAQCSGLDGLCICAGEPEMQAEASERLAAAAPGSTSGLYLFQEVTCK